eukprot:m.61799 g.61799  ORF g.61799 m.61799 type:complete len:178 (-) comp11881_c0_seq1:514-1047(-)
MAMRTRTIVGTGVCFGVAFALNAYTLASQQWVIRDFEGVSQYGMLRQCDESIYNDQFVTRCRFPPRLSGTWAATAMCMIVGLCILAYATYKAASAVADHRALSKAKWAGFWCGKFWMKWDTVMREQVQFVQLFDTRSVTVVFAANLVRVCCVCVCSGNVGISSSALSSRPCWRTRGW